MSGKRTSGTRTNAACGALLAVGALLVGESRALAAPVVPSWPAIEKFVVGSLRESGNQPGDLLTRRDVEPIFDALVERGVQLGGVEEMYDCILPDDSSLAAAIRTPEGLKFMRSVATQPGAFDILERLSWVPSGRELLLQLIESPQGPQLFAKLRLSDMRNKLAAAAGDDPRLKNLLLPTGHIHTEAELLAHIKAGLGAK